MPTSRRIGIALALAVLAILHQSFDSIYSQGAEHF